MLLFRGHQTLRFCCAVLFLSLATGLNATVADPESEEALQLDQNIQVLKDEALLFSRDAQLVEEEFNYPPHSRVDIYISVEAAALLLHKVSINLDGGQPVSFEYTDADAKALLKSKGLQKIARFKAAKGSHRLHAEYVGNYADAKPEEMALADRYDVIFDKGLTPVSLELIVGKANRGGKPILRLKEWRPTQ